MWFPQNNATHFIWLSLHIHAHTYMNSNPNITEEFCVVYTCASYRNILLSIHSWMPLHTTDKITTQLTEKHLEIWGTYNPCLFSLYCVHFEFCRHLFSYIWGLNVCLYKLYLHLSCTTIWQGINNSYLILSPWDDISHFYLIGFLCPL